VRIGRVLRALRRRRGWRQRDLAGVAGISQTGVSLIERGHWDAFALRTVARVFAAVDARVVVDVSWRGGELDRLLDERHAALVGRIAGRLRGLGWTVAGEVTYSEFGERGSIDVLAVHPPTRAALVVEVKTELVSLEATARRLDEKVRLARRSLVGERFGMMPRQVGRVLVLPEISLARRRVSRLEDSIAVHYPRRGVAVGEWLRAPHGEMAGLLFLSLSNGRAARRTSGGSQRVRTCSPEANRAEDAGLERSQGAQVPSTSTRVAE